MVSPAETALAEDRLSAQAESLLRAKPVVPDQVGRSRQQTSDPLLAWDDAETLRELSRRIEAMRPMNDLDWGARSVPLESLPGGRQSVLQQATSQR